MEEYKKGKMKGGMRERERERERARERDSALWGQKKQHFVSNFPAFTHRPFRYK